MNHCKIIYSSSLLTPLNTGHTSNSAAFSAPHLWVFKHLQTQPFHSLTEIQVLTAPTPLSPLLCGLSMDFLQHFNVCLVPGSPRVDLFLHMRLCECSRAKGTFLLSLLLCSAALLMQASVQVTFIVSRTQSWGTFNSATIEEFLVSNAISLLMYFYT